MKKIIVIALVFLGINIATASEKVTPADQLRKEIATLLQDSELDIDQTEAQAAVSFTVTTEGKIVVLSVKSENPFMDGFVKNRLNYKKVNFRVTENGKIFNLPVKVVVES